jgi:hypothetical protein
MGFLSTSLVGFFGGFFWEFLPGIFVYHFVRDFCGVFGSWEFLGFLDIHGYLIRYIFFDKERSSKDKRKGTVQYKVLYYTF